jgi:hypothetical protein
MNKLILAATLGAATAGCQKTNIQLHAPGAPATPSTAYNDAFHFSIIGFIELSAPVDVGAACGPGGADSIHEEVSVLGGLVNIILGTYIPVLNVHNATVNCGGGGMPGPGPGPGPDAPPPPPST